MLHCDLKTRAPGAGVIPCVGGSGVSAKQCKHPVKETSVACVGTLTVVALRIRWSRYRLLSGLWTQSAGTDSIARKFFRQWTPCACGCSRGQPRLSAG